MSEDNEYPRLEFLGRGRRGKTTARRLHALQEYRERQRQRAAAEVSIRFRLLPTKEALEHTDETQRVIEKEQGDD